MALSFLIAAEINAHPCMKHVWLIYLKITLINELSFYEMSLYTCTKKWKNIKKWNKYWCLVVMDFQAIASVKFKCLKLSGNSDAIVKINPEDEGSVRVLKVWCIQI